MKKTKYLIINKAYLEYCAFKWTMNEIYSFLFCNQFMNKKDYFIVKRRFLTIISEKKLKKLIKDKEKYAKYLDIKKLNVLKNMLSNFHNFRDDYYLYE